jgi:large subunit ribosomal protein L5
VTATAPASEMPRLKQRYRDELRGGLKEQLGLTNVMQVPRLEKIVLNMGVGAATQQASLLEGAVSDLTVITGQKPVVTRARKSIAGFKLREGNAIGAKVTLRGDRMWEFLDRLISIAIPRIRDFRGLNPRSFDGRGNYSMGIREQIIFPEIDYDSIDQVRGLDVTITTSARTDEEAFALLESFGMPFSEEGRPGAAAAEAAAEDAEEERRKEEARARAEAEQAALEQLKEENPDAYAKPPEPEEGEEGEERQTETEES